MMNKIRFLTAGESHGKGLVGIIEGLPAGLEISEDIIAADLSRRQMGFGRGNRMKIEQDRAEIISGVRFGKSLGSPIGLFIQNKDWKNWKERMSVDEPVKLHKEVTIPRPGHADLAGTQKFGFTDIRNVLERSSARETAMRVALGAICRKLLKDVGIEVGSRVVQIHTAIDDTPISDKTTLEEMNRLSDQSPVRCLNSEAEAKMIESIQNAMDAGDSVGGIFEVIATGVPVGLGSYTHWDRKLQARLGEAIMSINAIKGVEFGFGFGLASKYGSEIHDEIGFENGHYVRYTNNSGGIEGGMSHGEPIVIRAVMKPIPTLTKPLMSVDIMTKEPKKAHKERTDSCAVPAASIVGEAMVCIILADALLDMTGGDTIGQIKENMTKRLSH